jgi:hypothetical protein
MSSNAWMQITERRWLIWDILRQKATYSEKTSANVTQPVVLTRKTFLSPDFCLRSTCQRMSRDKSTTYLVVTISSYAPG